MTNEELAVEIKNGNTQYTEQLWEQCERFIWMRAEEWSRHHLTASVGVEDLVQSGYFALIKATEYFEPDKGFTFLTFLGRTLLTEFSKTSGVRFGESKAVHDAKVKFRNAMSLDAPLSYDSEITLGETLSVKTSNPEFIVICRDFAERLHKTLNRIMYDVLTPEERYIIKTCIQDWITGREHVHVIQNLFLFWGWMRGKLQEFIEKRSKNYGAGITPENCTAYTVNDLVEYHISRVYMAIQRYENLSMMICCFRPFWN